MQTQTYPQMQNQQIIMGQPIYGQHIAGQDMINNPYIIQQQPVFGGIQTIITGPSMTVPYCANNYQQPIEIICPLCKKRCITMTHKEIGAGTFCASYCLLWITGFICCWIPCCVRDCQDTIHNCPHCGGEVGIKPYIFN